MLDHHPQIAWQEEFEYVVDPLDESGRPPSMEDYREWLSVNRIFQSSGFELDLKRDFVSNVHSFLAQKQTATGKPIVGATVHRHFAKLRQLWPDCRFIYLYRDGRDVARSIVTMGWAGSVYEAIPRWVEAEQNWAALREELESHAWTEVAYEDLIRQPEAMLSQLCKFLGVTFDRAMLDYATNTSYGPPDVKMTGQWRRKLSPRELGRIEAIAAEALQCRGYELSGYPLRPMPEWRKPIARVLDRIRRQQWRWGRYGIPLALAESICKRTGPYELWKSIRRRIDEVDIAHLR
jgi:hypothetical protein